MRFDIRLAVLAAFVLAAAFASPAFAGTKERLEALEAAVGQLQAAAPAALDSNAKVDRLEAEVRSLTGRVEELTHELEQTRARLEAVTAAVAGEAPGGAPINLSGRPASDTDLIANAITQSTGAQGAAAVELPLDADAAYTYASEFLLASDYVRAERAFSMFLETFPNHPRAADARFRLGEVYLATNKNTEAADTFIAFIRAYPNSARGAEAYLKLGTAFARLNQTTEACKVFKSMKSKYPNAAPQVVQRADVEMAKINCR